MLSVSSSTSRLADYIIRTGRRPSHWLSPGDMVEFVGLRQYHPSSMTSSISSQPLLLTLVAVWDEHRVGHDASSSRVKPCRRMFMFMTPGSTRMQYFSDDSLDLDDGLSWRVVR